MIPGSVASRAMLYFLRLIFYFIFDLSNGVGFGVEIGLGVGLRNMCEDCFKTNNVNKHKRKTAHRVLYFNKTT